MTGRQMPQASTSPPGVQQFKDLLIRRHPWQDGRRDTPLHLDLKFGSHAPQVSYWGIPRVHRGGHVPQQTLELNNYRILVEAGIEQAPERKRQAHWNVFQESARVGRGWSKRENPIFDLGADPTLILP